MKFLSVLTLLVFGFSGFSYAQGSFPAPYQVDTAKASGVNIRSGPGSRYPVIAAVQGGQSVMILLTEPSGNWGQITWNGLPAWVYMGLMQPAGSRPSVVTPAPVEVEAEVETPGPVEDGLTAAEAAARDVAEAAANAATAAAEAAAAEKISGIICEGTSPNWSARITGTRDFVLVDGENPPQHRIIENAGTSMNSPNIQMFTTLDYTGVLRGGQCNNGLRGKNYSLVLDLIFNDGESAKMYSGCCSVNGN